MPFVPVVPEELQSAYFALAREHNNANVLCVGRWVLTLDEIRELLGVWLDTPFSDKDRHRHRVTKLG